MKTRKLFTRAIAVVACLLLFSTNVLAASITINTAADEGVLKATIGGDAEGWVTFYAVDAGTQFPETATADALGAFADKVHHVDQYQKGESPIAVKINRRAGDAEKVDIYAFGNGVDQIQVKSGVRMVAGAELVDLPSTRDDYHVYTGDVDGATAEALRNFFADAGDIKVKYYPIGTSSAEEAAVEPIVCNADTKADFDFLVVDQTADERYIQVTYKGIVLDEQITLIEPNVPTSLVLANADTVFDAYYNGDVAELTIEEIEYAITNNTNGVNDDKNVTVTANYADGDPVVMDLEDLELTVTAEDSTIYDEIYTHKVVFELYGVSADPIYINLAKREVNGATADDVTISVFEGTTVNADYVKANIPASDLNFKFTWNDLKKVVTGYEATAEMTFTQVGLPTQDGEGNEVYTFEATLNGFTATFDLTVAETTMTSVSGTVKAFDTTGQNDNFANAVPVGAVVTAIPYNAAAIGNFRGTVESYMPVSTVVNDATGEFSLTLDPATKYTLVISHTKYIVKNIGTSEQEVYVANSILDENTLRVIEPIGQDVLSLGTINIRYAYMGDIDADGKLDTVDADLFRAQFGPTVPGIE